jgi:hypothetical protein
MTDHPRPGEVSSMDDVGFRFWLKLGGLIVLGGLVAMIVFLIIGAALLTWGALAAIVLVGLVLIGFAWLLDRRRAREAREWEEAARGL